MIPSKVTFNFSIHDTLGPSSSKKKTGGFPFSGLAESPLNLTNGSHNAANGWKMTVSFWDGFLAGVMLVSGRVIDFITRTQI